MPIYVTSLDTEEDALEVVVGKGWPYVRRRSRPTAGAEPNPCARRDDSAFWRSHGIWRGAAWRQAELHMPMIIKYSFS